MAAAHTGDALHAVRAPGAPPTTLRSPPVLVICDVQRPCLRASRTRNYALFFQRLLWVEEKQLQADFLEFTMEGAPLELVAASQARGVSEAFSPCARAAFTDVPLDHAYARRAVGRLRATPT